MESLQDNFVNGIVTNISITAAVQNMHFILRLMEITNEPLEQVHEIWN